jgi:hypothetical protein
MGAVLSGCSLVLFSIAPASTHHAVADAVAVDPSPPFIDPPSPPAKARQVEEPDEDFALLNSFRALEARFKALRPHIEKAIGDDLGDVWVYPASMTGAEGGANVLGCVYRPREISICSRKVLGMRDRGYDVPKLLDMILIHEAGHVYAWERYADGMLIRSGLEARQAFSALNEGHAEYLMTRVCGDLGLLPTVKKFDAAGRAWRYRVGEQFFTKLVDEMGYRRAFDHAFANPPNDTNEIEHPEVYLARTYTRSDQLARASLPPAEDLPPHQAQAKPDHDVVERH